jgi:hypothetical protein
MSEAQKEAVKDEFFTLCGRWMGGVLRHGDCIGADAEAHGIWREFGTTGRIEIYPPINKKNRAFCEGDFVHEPRAYFARNRLIVDESDRLIACPAAGAESNSPGTWHAISYALGRGKKVKIISANGNVSCPNGW